MKACKESMAANKFDICMYSLLPGNSKKTMELQYLFSSLFYFYVESHDLGTITDIICDS